MKCNLRRIFVSLVTLIMCVGFFAISAQAGSYPSVFFFSDEDYENLIIKDNVTVGDVYSIRMEWFAEFNNEGYDLVIYDSEGDKVASASSTWSNINSIRYMTVTWDTTGCAEGNYTVEVTKNFYSYYRWNEAPTKNYLYLTLKCSHNWNSVDITKQPTCTEEGIKTFTCSICGGKKTESVPATGHKLTKTAAKAATCTAAGNIEYYICSVCTRMFSDSAGTKEITTTSVDPLGHQPENIPAVTATCTKAGKTEGSRCSVCKAILKEQKAVAAVGHKFSDWKTITPATAISTGIQEGTCSICGEKETTEIPKLKPMLKIGKSVVKLGKTKSIFLKVTFAKGDKITVKSSNPKIAKAAFIAKNNSLKIAAQKTAGTATIIVVTKTRKKAVIKVTVPKVKTTKVTCKAVSVKKGKTVKLKPVVKPALSDDKLTFKSADPKIAAVSAKGVVKGVEKGNTTITVKSGKKSVKVKVTVK